MNEAFTRKDHNESRFQISSNSSHRGPEEEEEKPNPNPQLRKLQKQGEGGQYVPFMFL